MKIIGLTGGVACGKSTVADFLHKKGLPVIDTDVVARKLLDSDGGVRTQVNKDLGTLDRIQLRKMVFSSPEKRKVLEDILHPEIRKVVEEKIANIKKHPPLPPAIIVVVPLLYEAGWDKNADVVIAVICAEKLQIQRLEKRSQIDETLAREIIASQISNAEKSKRADHVVENNGTLEDLEKAVEMIAGKL